MPPMHMGRTKALTSHVFWSQSDGGSSQVHPCFFLFFMITFVPCQWDLEMAPGAGQAPAEQRGPVGVPVSSISPGLCPPSLLFVHYKGIHQQMVA